MVQSSAKSERAIHQPAEGEPLRGRAGITVDRGGSARPVETLDGAAISLNGPLTDSHLEALDLLSAPLWVWDLGEGQVTWANTSALRHFARRDAADLDECLAGTPRLNGQALDGGLADELFRGPEGETRASETSLEGVLSVPLSDETLALLCRCVPVTTELGKKVLLLEILPDPLGEAESDSVKVSPAAQLTADTNRIVLQGQNEVLELMGRGADLESTLSCVAGTVERLVPEVSAAILLVDPKQQAMQCAAAPSLPADLRQRVAELSGGSGGTRLVPLGQEQSGGEESTVTEVSGYVLCWSRPLLAKDDQAIGSLDLLAQAPIDLTPEQESALVDVCGLARFAIETVRQKRQLASANERFTSLAASIPGVVYQRRVRPDGDIRYTYISDGAQDLFGVSPKQIVEDPQALFDRHGAEYYATFRERLIAASKELKMWDVEATLVMPDGQRKFTHAIARPHREPDGSVVWNGVILDQTRIKEAELEAAAAEARTRETIVESIPQGFVLFDEKEMWVTCNSLFLDFYPYLKDIASPETSYEQVQKAIIEIELEGEDGTNADPTASAETRLAEKLELHGQGQHTVEYRLADGRWILINEKQTAAGGTVILLTDVTDLKLREAELERSNRELQDFASVASHDLQEPLRKIEAFGDRLAAKCGDRLGDDGSVYLERMQNAAGRMRSLINALLSYSRVTTKAKPFVPVDFTQLTSDVLSDLQVAIEESEAEIVIGDLPTIDADPLQIQLLLQNLLSNALKFRREGVAPKIEITASSFMNSGTEAEFGVPIGEVCLISIADNGIGFEMKYLDRVFNIFQRLHGRNDYPGTGIGLATCRKIVERHHGVITAQSEPDKGTTFLVTLPLRQANMEQAA